MDSLEIEAFLAIIYYGNLTNAANSLFLSQSTLSHRIAKLEQELSVSLFDRGRGFKSLSLTENGKEFLAIAKRWEELVSDTKKIKTRTKKSSITIGAVDSIHNYILAPVYKELNKHTKDVEVKVKTYNSTELYLQLERGTVDVAFALLELPMDNMIVEKFYSEPMVLAIKERKKQKSNKIIDLKDIDSSKEIFMDWGPSFKAWYNGYRGENENAPMSVDTAQLLYTFMDDYGKWAIIPSSMAKEFASTGEFALYKLKDEPPERVCYKIQLSYPRKNSIKGLEIFNSCLEIVKYKK